MGDVVTTVGIDLGKTTFHLIGFDGRGAIVLRQKVSRAQLERRFAALPPCLVGMEACCGAHHVGRQLAALGHEVRLIPARYVKPFVKSNKNGFRDAEAVLRPTMVKRAALDRAAEEPRAARPAGGRPPPLARRRSAGAPAGSTSTVPLKSREQLDLQAGAPPRAPAAGRRAHGGDQPDPRLPPRARDHGARGPAGAAASPARDPGRPAWRPLAGDGAAHPGYRRRL